MIRIELDRFNDSFDILLKRINVCDKSSLSSIYDAILPWNKACREDEFPQLSTIFKGYENSYSSWKEIEESLPNITFSEILDNKLILECDDDFLNQLILFRLFLINGSDVIVTSDKEFILKDDNLDNLKYLFSLYGVDYSFTSKEVKLEHIKKDN